MKKIVEYRIPENVDVVEKIYETAKGFSRSWIYVSKRISKILEKKYKFYDYRDEMTGTREYEIGGKYGSFKVETGSCWDKIGTLYEKIDDGTEVVYYPSNDPQFIVFLN